MEQQGVIASLGQTVSLILQMQVGGVTETLVVTASAPLVDTQSTTAGAILPNELFSRVPVGRRVTDTLYLAPGVSSTSVGGGPSGESRANPSLAGSSGLDNLYVIDGVNITNTGYGAIGSYSIVFGSLGQATPFDFVKEVQVKTGSYEAEYGQSIGGVVNVVTKSGSNNLRGSLFGYSRPSGLEGKWKELQTANGAVNTTKTQMSDVGVEGGFPIVQDRLFGFGAINPAWETRTFTAPDRFPLQSLGDVDRERQTLSYSAKLTWQATNTHRVDASFFSDPSEGDIGAQRSAALKAETTSQFSALEYGGHNQTVRYDAVVSNHWLMEASFARAYTNLAEIPSVSEWNVRDRRVTPNVITGGVGFFETNDGVNLQYEVKSTNIFGGHQLKYGFLYEDVEWNQGSNGRSKLFANYGRFFARVPNDLAARALSADEGIARGDYFDANLTQPVPEGVLAAGVTRHFILAGAHPSQIDPDARLSYKDEFVLGYEWEAMPNTSVGLRYIFRTVGRALEDVALFPMVGYDLGHPDAGGVEYIMTNPTSSFPTLAPELGAKHEDPIHNYNAIELTANRRLADNWMLISSYHWSRLHGSYEGFFREDNGQSDPALTSLYDFPTNDPSYTAIGVPQFGYQGDIRFLGKLSEGPLPLDRPHQVKVFGNYTFDMGLNFGVGLNLSSGKPLTALAANPAYTNDGEIPLGRRGSDIQTADGFKKRTPFESQVDLQASYGFELADTRRVTSVR